MYTERLRQLEGVVVPSESAPRLHPDDGRNEENDKPGAQSDEASYSMRKIHQLSILFSSSRGLRICRFGNRIWQVRSNSIRLHTLPFSLLPVVSRCIQTQGFAFLWKGLGSVFIVRGLCFLSENILSEITSLPKEVSRLSSLRRISGHVLLRILSWIFVTPFYAASVVELVQSEKASEPTSLISCLRDGFLRLFHMPSTPRLGTHSNIFRGGKPLKSFPITTTRLLPVWRLIPPVVLLNVGHYIVRSVACIVASAYWGEDEDRLERDAEVDLTFKTGGCYRTASPYSSDSRSEYHRSRDLSPTDRLALAHQRQETALQSMYMRYYTDLLSAMTANLVADVVTYPLETLVIRLCVQGTRTLVDNMDTGDVVVPIVSAYDGLIDALRYAVDSPSGILGLYRGFGALIAQYALQAAFLYGIRYLYQQILYMWPPSVHVEGRPEIKQHALRHVYESPSDPSGDTYDL
ncbi:hypothetical protein X801_09079, partial [Opisthorchis viverrini]